MKPALLVTLAAACLLAPSCGTIKQKIRGPVEAVVTLPSATPGQLEEADEDYTSSTADAVEAVHVRLAELARGSGRARAARR